MSYRLSNCEGVKFYVGEEKAHYSFFRY